MNFDIKTEQLEGDGYVISLAGEVDLYTAPEFKAQLLDVIGKGGKQVIVDFTDTTFIDSTTLGVLVGGVKRLRTNDGELSLVCSDRNITKIFEITGLDRVFTIYPTRAEAIEQIGASGPPGLVRTPRLRSGRCLQPRRCSRPVAARAASPRARPTPPTARSSSSEKCGSCHTLADAGTQGKIGPNLDDAFSGPRSEGFKESTIRNVVHDQILYAIEQPVRLHQGPERRGAARAGHAARPRHGQRREGRRGLRRLGRRRLRGRRRDDDHGDDELDAGARASAADDHDGTTTTSGGGSDLVAQGKEVFAKAGCASCHTLKDAGATGTVGPNLDDAKPPKELVVDRVTNGKAPMPSFKGQLSDQEIQAVAEYVSTVAGK